MLLENVKRLCEREGITTYGLAIKCGMTGGAIDKWAFVSPRLENVKAVADYFHTTVDELLKEETNDYQDNKSP